MAKRLGVQEQFRVTPLGIEQEEPLGVDEKGSFTHGWFRLRTLVYRMQDKRSPFDALPKANHYRVLGGAEHATRKPQL